MFDTHHVSHHTHVDAGGPDTVVVKRAPTEESVRLLREMEEAAAKSLVGKFSLPGNMFQGTVFVLNNDCRGFDVRLVFDINGTRHHVTSAWDLYGKTPEEKAKLLRALFDKFAREIALVCFAPLTQQLMRLR